MFASIESHLKKDQSVGCDKNLTRISAYISCFSTVPNRIMRINKVSFHIYCFWGGVVIRCPTFLTVWTWKHEWVFPCSAKKHSQQSELQKKTKYCELFFGECYCRPSKQIIVFKVSQPRTWNVKDTLQQQKQRTNNDFKWLSFCMRVCVCVCVLSLSLSIHRVSLLRDRAPSSIMSLVWVCKNSGAQIKNAFFVCHIYKSSRPHNFSSPSSEHEHVRVRKHCWDGVVRPRLAVGGSDCKSRKPNKTWRHTGGWRERA